MWLSEAGGALAALRKNQCRVSTFLQALHMMRLGAETLDLLKDVGWLGRSHGTVLRAFGGEQSKLALLIVGFWLLFWICFCKRGLFIVNLDTFGFYHH